MRAASALLFVSKENEPPLEALEKAIEASDFTLARKHAKGRSWRAQIFREVADALEDRGDVGYAAVLAWRSVRAESAGYLSSVRVIGRITFIVGALFACGILGLADQIPLSLEALIPGRRETMIDALATRSMLLGTVPGLGALLAHRALRKPVAKRAAEFEKWIRSLDEIAEKSLPWSRSRAEVQSPPRES